MPGAVMGWLALVMMGGLPFFGELPGSLDDLEELQAAELISDEQASQLAAWLTTPVNVNAAARADLAALPGMTLETADRLMEGRPYASAADLARALGALHPTLAPYVTVDVPTDPSFGTTAETTAQARVATQWTPQQLPESLLQLGAQHGVGLDGAARIAWQPNKETGAALQAAHVSLQRGPLAAVAGSFVAAFGEGLTFASPGSGPPRGLGGWARLRVPRDPGIGRFGAPPSPLWGAAVSWGTGDRGWSVRGLGAWRDATRTLDAHGLALAHVAYGWSGRAALGATAYGAQFARPDRALRGAVGIHGRWDVGPWESAAEYSRSFAGLHGWELSTLWTPAPWAMFAGRLRLRDAQLHHPYFRPMGPRGERLPNLARAAWSFGSGAVQGITQVEARWGTGWQGRIKQLGVLRPSAFETVRPLVELRRGARRPAWGAGLAAGSYRWSWLHLGLTGRWRSSSGWRLAARARSRLPHGIHLALVGSARVPQGSWQGAAALTAALNPSWRLGARLGAGRRGPAGWQPAARLWVEAAL